MSKTLELDKDALVAFEVLQDYASHLCKVMSGEQAVSRMQDIFFGKEVDELDSEERLQIVGVAATAFLSTLRNKEATQTHFDRNDQECETLTLNPEAVERLRLMTLAVSVVNRSHKRKDIDEKAESLVLKAAAREATLVDDLFMLGAATLNFFDVL